MDQHYYACRRNGALYDFAISGQRSDYAGASCPGDSMFDVPRTGLQNTYLLRAWQTERSEDDRPDELLWLNFNNIDSELCWVRGQNSTCPYVRRASNNRTVVVPTIAAIALFALAVLTVLVKCASNRRNSKRSRRRRGGDGWDYEGVPS